MDPGGSLGFQAWVDGRLHEKHRLSSCQREASRSTCEAQQYCQPHVATWLSGLQLPQKSVHIACFTSETCIRRFDPPCSDSSQPLLTFHVSTMMHVVGYKDSAIPGGIRSQSPTPSGENDEDDGAVGVGEEAV